MGKYQRSGSVFVVSAEVLTWVGRVTFQEGGLMLQR